MLRKLYDIAAVLLYGSAMCTFLLSFVLLLFWSLEGWVMMQGVTIITVLACILMLESGSCPVLGIWPRLRSWIRRSTLKRVSKLKEIRR